MEEGKCPGHSRRSRVKKRQSKVRADHREPPTAIFSGEPRLSRSARNLGIRGSSGVLGRVYKVEPEQVLGAQNRCGRVLV